MADTTTITASALSYCESMRLGANGEFMGYRHSSSTDRPIVYALAASLMIKYLINIKYPQMQDELSMLLSFQDNDGLFKDPVIACGEAETEDWWGWRHLTLYTLMTLALYNVKTLKPIHYIDQYRNKDFFKNYLEARDWGERAAWTSNELQNIGVMLQYSRDYLDDNEAGDLLEILYEVIDSKQDPLTGLFGNCFETPSEHSNGVQAGYHFWLLQLYDNRPVKFIERIIDSLLKTQNTAGGYGVNLNSSACEDIDSIDPLIRFSKITDYRREDIQNSLKRALPWILQNMNPDGGWVFRRNEELTVVHPQMHSANNQSNLFYTWFRLLGLAYCLNGLNEVPENMRFDWNFTKAPGHQFV